MGTPPPDPLRAASVAEYIDALKALREWSGLTYRQIGDKTRDYPRRLAASTWCGALKRGTLPSRDLVESFLRALELDDATAARWLDVWDCLNDRRAVRSVLRRRQVGQHGPVQPQPARSAPPAVTDAAPVWSDIRDWVLIDGSWQATNAEVQRGSRWSDRRWPAEVIVLGVCTVLLVVMLAMTAG